MVDVGLRQRLAASATYWAAAQCRTDEQHASAGGGHVAHGTQRAIQQRHRLLQIDDVHLVAHAEQVWTHRRVPAARVVAKMDAGFEELAQGVFGHRHGAVSFRFVRLYLRGAKSWDLEVLRHRTRLGRGRRPAWVNYRRHAGGQGYGENARGKQPVGLPPQDRPTGISGRCAEFRLDADELVVFRGAVAADRLPVLIWPKFVATARSAIVASSVSPERWLHDRACSRRVWAISTVSSVSERVPI